ncbi:MAG: hypothetical protein Q9191_001402 [Dirinaria sp. TL-2023a]
MKTRAQRQKDKEAGAPTSPAHELPPIQPRRATKSTKARNVQNTPARTAVRNAARKASERESAGETTNTNSSFSNDVATETQSSEVAAEPDIAEERAGESLEHADSEADKSLSTSPQQKLLNQSTGQQAALPAAQSPHGGPVQTPRVVSPFVSPATRAVPDDEILGQGAYAPSPYSSSPFSSSLSSAPSYLSTPSQSGASPLPAASEAPSDTAVGPNAASVPPAPIYPSREWRKARPMVNKLGLGHDTLISSDNSSLGETPSVDGRSSEASPTVDDGLSPTSRVWRSAPVAKLTSNQVNTLRRYGKTFPEEPYAILHLWEAPTLQDLESARPVSVPTLAVAVPKAQMGDTIKSLLARYPGTTAPPKLTDAAVQTGGSPTAIKRKSTDDGGDARPARRVRFSEDESPSPPRPRRRRKHLIGYRPGPMYTVQGKLKLGQPDIPVYAYSDSEPEEEDEDDTDMENGAKDGESSNDNIPAPASDSAQQQQQQSTSYQVVETPSRWGIGKILDSASRYLPGFGRRPRPVAIPFPLTITPPLPSGQSQQHSQTEPRFNTQRVIASETPATAQPGRRSRRTDKTYPESNKVAKTKRATARDSQRMSRRNKRFQDEANAAEGKARNSQIERDFVDQQIRILNEDKARKALAAQFQWRREKRANPASTQKRPPSPEVIPNPKGCSYGFDPDYFVIDDTDDEPQPPSPTPELPSKSPFGGLPPPDPLVGSRKKAQPYKGVFFRDLTRETPAYDGGNVFRELAVENAATEKAATVKRSAVATPKKSKVKEPPRTPSGVLITNMSGHFTVPSDSDSDEESETSAGEAASTAAGPESATPAASPEKPIEQQTASTSQATSSTSLKSKAQAWTQPPPPPPNPSHASLPSTASNDSESLKAARAKALQHAPRRPSGLRESSRITSSPVAAGGNDAVETQEASTTSQPLAEKQKTVRFALDEDTAHREQAVDNQQASTTTQPPAEEQKAARSAEAIAELERDVANKPTPPLHEVLGVLTEKSPNGQIKASSAAMYDKKYSDTNMVQAPTKASPASETEASTKTDSSPVDPLKVSPRYVPIYPPQDSNPLQTPNKAALLRIAKLPNYPEGYRLGNGQFMSKQIQLSVEAQRTEDVVNRQNEAVYLDYRGWLSRRIPSPQQENMKIPQDDLDRSGNATAGNYHHWSEHNSESSI